MNEPSSLQRNREQQRNRNKENKRGGGGSGRMMSSSSTTPSASSKNKRQRRRCPPSSASPSPPSITDEKSLSTISEAARTRRFSVVELIYLLSPDTTPLTISTSPPRTPPSSGALFLYNRSVTRTYKDDRIEWLKKRVSSKCSRWKVREDDVKLRLNRQCRVKAWYARSSSIPTLRRRSYYLLDPTDSTKQLHDLVLVHYLDTEGGATVTSGRGDGGGGGGGGGDGLPVPAAGDAGCCAATSKIETAASRLPTENGRSDLHFEMPHRRVDSGGLGQVESNVTMRLPSGASSLAGLSAPTGVAPAAHVADRRLSGGGAVAHNKAIVDKLLHGVNGRLLGAVVSPRVSGAANPAQWIAGVASRNIADQGGIVGLDGHIESVADRRLSLAASSPHEVNTDRRHSLAASSAQQQSIVDRRLSLAASSAHEIADRRNTLTTSSAEQQANDATGPSLTVSSSSVPENSKDDAAYWPLKMQPFPQEMIRDHNNSKGVSGSSMAIGVGINDGATQAAVKEFSGHPFCTKGKRKHCEDSVLSPTTLAGHMVNSPFFKFFSEQASIQVAPRITDEELAKEWETSTEKERIQAVADIYGNEVVEDTSSAHSSLAQFLHMAKNESQALRLSLMDQEVEKMPPQAKSSLLQAMRHCPELVTSTNLRLHFLRCDDYSPRPAARRLVNYWAKRVETFGVDRAFLPLTLEGAMADDYDELAKGYTRILPGTDASGRGILLVDNSRKCSFVTQIRSLWYMAHAALENESVLRNGIVIVIYRSPPVEIIKTEFIMERQRLFRDILPFRLRVVHHCQFHPNSWLTRAGQFTAGKYMRTRVMSQEGSTEEVLLKLAECGISRSQLPTELGGTITDADFQQWLAARRQPSSVPHF